MFRQANGNRSKQVVDWESDHFSNNLSHNFLAVDNVNYINNQDGSRKSSCAMGK